MIVGNNYIHDVIEASGSFLVAISIAGDDAFVFNNIIENVEGPGSTAAIRINAWNNAVSNLRLFNNTIYNIRNEGGSDRVSGIDLVSNGSNVISGDIRNNIIHTVTDQGAGSTAYGINCQNGGCSAILSNNFAYNVETAWGGGLSCSSCSTSDPGLTDPAGGDFSIGPSSNANDAGTSMSTYFNVDNHDADSPTVFDTWPTLAVTKPVERDGSWDVGAYVYDEYVKDDPPGPPDAPTGVKISSR